MNSEMPEDYSIAASLRLSLFSCFLVRHLTPATLRDRAVYEAMCLNWNGYQTLKHFFRLL